MIQYKYTLHSIHIQCINVGTLFFLSIFYGSSLFLSTPLVPSLYSSLSPSPASSFILFFLLPCTYYLVQVLSLVVFSIFHACTYLSLNSLLPFLSNFLLTTKMYLVLISSLLFHKLSLSFYCDFFLS